MKNNKKSVKKVSLDLELLELESRLAPAVSLPTMDDDGSLPASGPGPTQYEGAEC